MQDSRYDPEKNPSFADKVLSGDWPLRDGAMALHAELAAEAAERKSTEIARFADVAMYPSEPIETDESDIVRPKVTIISATPMPLRTMCAGTDLYKGKITRSARDVTAEEAMAALGDMTNTALKAGLEFIDFHFFIEGVSRSLANQMTRQRTAVFIQESLRFAVKNGERLPAETVMPPSIEALKDDAPQRVIWTEALESAGNTYDSLVNSGIPAEDARGLLPLNTSTRLHYKTDLRGLIEHSGMRLCTQAQFEWRVLWAEIVGAVHTYSTNATILGDRWEFQQIAKLFKPICYRTGKCEFMGSADRHCNIRDRVNAHHDAGEPSRVWVDINPREWLENPASARRTS